MIKVNYTRYYNDYRKFNEAKTFYTLDEVADWLFEMVNGSYKRAMWFVNPDDEHIFEGKLRLDSSCIHSHDGDYAYWVDMITKDGVIIYSDGKLTNNICHWNDEIKDWLRSCRNRMNNPQFNFG